MGPKNLSEGMERKYQQNFQKLNLISRKRKRELSIIMLLYSGGESSQYFETIK